MFGTVIALASLYGLIVCYLGQYYPMIAYCIYLIAGTVLMIVVSVYIGMNFTEIKQNTRNEASRMWKLTKASTGWTKSIEKKVKKYLNFFLILINSHAVGMAVARSLPIAYWALKSIL